MLSNILVGKILATVEDLIKNTKDEAVRIKSEPSLYKVGVSDGRNAALEEVRAVVTALIRRDPDDKLD